MSDETNEPGGDQQPQDATFRSRREASGRLATFRKAWRERRWLRRFGYLCMAGLIGLIGFWIVLSHDLPDANKLLEYQPPLPTMVRGIDGEIVYSYARERRVQLRYVDFPDPLVNAFLSAEDRTFWTHGGVDYGGFLGAVVDYISKYGTGERAKGG